MLLTPIRPPISSTIFREMARPSPVPPNLRDDDVSACTNGWNNFLISSGVRPMPVSVTSNRNTTLPGVWKCVWTRTTTSPCSVNLTPLPTRLSSTCRSRIGSPVSRCGTSRRTMAASAIFFPAAREAAFSSTESTTGRTEKSSRAIVILPASILEKSSTSLMTWSRALALSTAASANSR